METIRFIYYQETNMWVGWLEEFPDYRSQGKTIEELKDNLREMYQDLTSGEIPQVRRRGELVIG